MFVYVFSPRMIKNGLELPDAKWKAREGDREKKAMIRK